MTTLVEVTLMVTEDEAALIAETLRDTDEGQSDLAHLSDLVGWATRERRGE